MLVRGSSEIVKWKTLLDHQNQDHYHSMAVGWIALGLLDMFIERLHLSRNTISMLAGIPDFI